MNSSGTDDADVAAVEAAAQGASYLQQQADADPSNKWSKNGFGAPVSKMSGKFSKDESELVRKSIEEYCAAKQITVARLCSECDHKAELKGAWMEIAKRLPHRSVQSVYRHGIRQCHPFRRGAWSEQECVTLLDLVQRLGKKWSAIQAKLNRSADSCRDKYREMSDEFIKGRWKEAETESLQRIIREQLNAPPEADMKDLGRMVEEQGIQIPWSNISKKMGKRSRLSCFKKWQKMTGLFSPADEGKRGKMPSGEGGESTDEPRSKRLKRERDDDDDEDDDNNEEDEDDDVDHGEDGGDQKQARFNAATFLRPPTHTAPTAGAAAAMAAAAAAAALGHGSSTSHVINTAHHNQPHHQSHQPGDNYDVYSAKMAAETVEAVELPDTVVLGPTIVPTREI